MLQCRPHSTTEWRISLVTSVPSVLQVWHLLLWLSDESTTLQWPPMHQKVENAFPFVVNSSRALKRLRNPSPPTIAYGQSLEIMVTPLLFHWVRLRSVLGDELLLLVATRGPSFVQSLTCFHRFIVPPWQVLYFLPQMLQPSHLSPSLEGVLDVESARRDSGERWFRLCMRQWLRSQWSRLMSFSNPVSQRHLLIRAIGILTRRPRVNFRVIFLKIKTLFLQHWDRTEGRSGPLRIRHRQLIPS